MPIILAVAVVFSVVGNWEYIFGDKKKKPNVAAAPSAQAQQVQQAQVPKEEPKKEAKKAVPKKQADSFQMSILTQETDWGLDPFGFKPKEEKPKEVVKVVKKKKKKKNVALKVTSILIAEPQPVAVINGELVVAGQMLSGFKIVSIKEDRVIVLDDDETRTLKLEQHGINISYAGKPPNPNKPGSDANDN